MSGGKVRTISATTFQRNLGYVIDSVRNGKDAVTITAHGRPQVVIVSVDEYERLTEAQRQLAWIRLAKIGAEEPSGATE